MIYSQKSDKNSLVAQSVKPQEAQGLLLGKNRTNPTKEKKDDNKSLIDDNVKQKIAPVHPKESNQAKKKPKTVISKEKTISKEINNSKEQNSSRNKKKPDMQIIFTEKPETAKEKSSKRVTKTVKQTENTLKEHNIENDEFMHHKAKIEAQEKNLI